MRMSLARQAHLEGRPDASLAVDPHLDAERRGERARHAEPESRSAGATRMRLLHLPERVEDPLQILRSDADPGVAHLEADRVTIRLRGESDPTAFGELDRVGHQIDQ